MFKSYVIGATSGVLLVAIAGFLFLPQSDSSEMIEYLRFDMPGMAQDEYSNYFEFATKNDEMYVLAHPSMSNLLHVRLLPDADIESIQMVADSNGVATQYAADTAHVYYVGGEGRSESTLLEGVSPKNFIVLSDDLSLAKSDTSVYFYDRILEDLDPNSVVLREDRILYDQDGTVWYPSGDCHFSDYEKGSVSDIGAWIPPCS